MLQEQKLQKLQDLEQKQKARELQKQIEEERQ